MAEEKTSEAVAAQKEKSDRDLFSMSKEDVAKEFIDKVSRKSELEFAALYGSVAEGRAEKDSDIDVLLVAKRDLDKLDREAHKQVIDILKDTDELVSPIVISDRDFKRNKRLKTPYITNVLKGKILYGA